MVVIYQNRSFSWNINKIGSKVEKNYGLNFGSGEPFCELISKFRIKYWLWYIKIDRFHWLSIKLVQNWKQLYGLTFGSSEPFWELISEYYMRYSLWYIKIDSFHKPSMIHCIQAVCNVSVFGVICCNCHQRFTSGCIYTSTSIFLEVSQKPPRALRMTKFMFCVARIWKPHNTHRPYEAWSYHTHGVIRHYPPFPQF